MDVDEATAARREKVQWQLLMLLGVAVALWGSYMAVNAAFDDDTFCFEPLSCVTIDDSDDIWLGLVLTVAGVAGAWKARSRLVSRG